MTLFECKIFKHKSLTDARAKENTFIEFLEKCGLAREGFLISTQTDVSYKGKPLTFYIESYGYYQVEGGWKVYITYKANWVDHVRMHTWNWDGEKANILSHNLMEFINI